MTADDAAVSTAPVAVHDRRPGLYRQDVFPAPAPGFQTGVPVFLGRTSTGTPYEPRRLTLWPQFAERFGAPHPGGYLAPAVRGFFENEGLVCYVVPLEGDAEAPARTALRRGLDALRGLDDVDLVCAPDVLRTDDPDTVPGVEDVVALQADVLDHCQGRIDRFALLDGYPGQVRLQRGGLSGDSGALYHPWVGTAPAGTEASGAAGGPLRYVPPCGHVAGIVSRCDTAVGVHKPPANEVVEGVLDLRVDVDPRYVDELYARGVNFLQAFPGRGIRVWGARTLSTDPTWRHVNVRRVFLTLGRWLERFMAGLVDEPNDVRLWVRIMRDLTAHLEDLYRRGALMGRTPDEAFFVKCDGETNPPEVVDAGMVVTHVGVAVAAPAEVVVVRIIHGASGVSITTSP
jgi:phage tail sheath protein FI